jgi:glyoxylase-like metal-dependent hydrolase (beta-lactamase superfamily II)
MRIDSFFHPQTFTLTYLVYDETTKDAVLIDSVVDYDPKGSTISFKSTELVKERIQELELNLHYLLETHAHADHLTGTAYLKKAFPSTKVGIGEQITAVQGLFKDFFQNGKESEGKSFDVLFKDGEQIQAGSLSFKVIATPGHTPACVSYLFNEKALFTGDLLFAPDFGTGRCDFPGGSSKDMYNSLKKIYSLDDSISVYPGHDYMPGGRMVWDNARLGLHKKENVQFKEGTSEEGFCKRRDARDAGLAAPNLLLQSVQFNAWGGKLPGEGGDEFLKIPLRVKS